MKRVLLLVIVALLLAGTVSGCKKEQTVTVTHGEVVICTEGEIVSDTTEEITVPESEVANYSVTTRIETCDLHKKLADLYAQAQAAIAKGDLDAAKALLEQVVQLSPVYGDAGDQLAQIQAGKTPESGSGSSSGNGGNGGTTTPGDDEPEPTGPIMNLAHYVPDTLTGFVAQGIIVDPFVITREYIPAKKGDVTHLVIVAEQFQDTADAREEIDTTIKQTYPDNAESFKIGNKEAYFGTRANVAIVAFIDGGILVAAEGAASSDDGASIESAIKAVAEEIGK